MLPSKKELIQASKTIILALALSVGVSYVFAWTGPTLSAPNGNVSAPINVGNIAQTKVGQLLLAPVGLPTNLATLDVTGTVFSEGLFVNGSVAITGGNPGAGKVLTSDDNGVASWQAPTSGSSSSGGAGTYYVATGGSCPTGTGSLIARNPEGQWGASYASGWHDGIGDEESFVYFFPSQAAFTLALNSSSFANLRSTPGWTALGDVVVCGGTTGTTISCPSGTTQITSVAGNSTCIENTRRTSASVLADYETCTLAGMHICSTGQLKIACSQIPSVFPANGTAEKTGDYTPDTNIEGVIFAKSSGGVCSTSIAGDANFRPLPFRCCQD